MNCQEGSCMEDNDDSVACVKTCDGGALEDEWGCEDAFCLCTDCRVKEYQKRDWKKCCPVCVRTVAPVLVSENARLCEEIEKLRLDK